MRDRRFAAALSQGDNPPINLVITFHRNGKDFARFFRSLFQLMWAGKSMPMAWVQLAPQIPGPPPRTLFEKLRDLLGSLFRRSRTQAKLTRSPDDRGPGSIFLAERGQVGFAPRPQSNS